MYKDNFDEELFEFAANQRDYIHYLRNPFAILDDERAMELELAVYELDKIVEELKRRKVYAH